MADTRASTERINVRPADLQPGDIIRDRGIERVISHVVSNDWLRDTVAVRFERIEGYPDALGIEAAVTVTAWRAGS